MMIRDCLEQRKADVTELYQSLSPSMNDLIYLEDQLKLEIQQAITECIEACFTLKS